MDKDQQIHEIVLAYMAATDAHIELDQHRARKTISPEDYAKKYLNYFDKMSSVLDTTK